MFHEVTRAAGRAAWILLAFLIISRQAAVYADVLRDYQSGQYVEVEKTYHSSGNSSTTARADFSRGVKKLKERDIAAAIHYFQAVLKKEPASVAAMNNIGIAYMWNEDPANARAWFEKAIKTDKYYRNAYINLGAVLVYQGDFESLGRLADRMLQVFGDDPDGWLGKGIFFYERRELTRATECLEKALEGLKKLKASRETVAREYLFKSRSRTRRFEMRR